MKSAANRSLQACQLLVLMMILCVSLLGVLSMISAREDEKLARRQADTALGMQECMNQAQHYIAQLDDQAEEGSMIEEKFADEAGHFACIQLKKTKDYWIITGLTCYTEWIERGPMGNLLQSP